SGARLAACLWRLSQDDSDVSDRVAATLSELADVRDVRVIHDERRDVLTLEARLSHGPFLPAKSLSEGTLRFLALALIEEDNLFHGLICMEEPENGIHPAKLPAMVDLLKALSVDPFESPGSDNPLRQVIVNTHSPDFVREQHPEDLLIATRVDFNVRLGNVAGVEFSPMINTWRSAKGGPHATVSSVSSYLRDPRESHLFEELPLFDEEGAES